MYASVHRSCVCECVCMCAQPLLEGVPAATQAHAGGIGRAGDDLGERRVSE